MRLLRWLCCTMVLLSGPLLLHAQDPCSRDAQPAYDDSEDGLQQLFTDIIVALRNKNEKQARGLAESLEISDPNRCFESIFGKKEGKRLADTYKKFHRYRDDPIPGALRDAAKEPSPKIEIQVIRKTDAILTTLERSTLEAMQSPVSLYNVSYKKVNPKDSWSIGYFLFAGGGFRSVNFTILHALSTSPPLQIRVGGSVQVSRLIRKQAPHYPASARVNRIEGTVRLRAVIAKDGTIRKLEVVSGPPELVESALEAVRQWRYQPTLLNGIAVEVQTTIDVVYTLSH